MATMLQENIIGKFRGNLNHLLALQARLARKQHKDLLLSRQRPTVTSPSGSIWRGWKAKLSVCMLSCCAACSNARLSTARELLVHDPLAPRCSWSRRCLCTCVSGTDRCLGAPSVHMGRYRRYVPRLRQLVAVYVCGSSTLVSPTRPPLSVQYILSSGRPDVLEKRPATHAVHDVAPERQSQLLIIRIQLSSSGQYAPDALENSPGSHAAQALAPATQDQMITTSQF